MKSLSRLFFLFLILQTSLYSCRRTSSEALVTTDTLPDSVVSAIDMTSEAWRMADSAMACMSDEQLIGQLFMPAMYARSSAYDLRHLTEYAAGLHVGGIVLLKGDLKSAAILADSLRHMPGPPRFVAVDAENGLRMRFPDAPEFPWGREMGRITDDQLLYDFGREIARECRAIGVTMVLGPVLDVVPGQPGSNIMERRSLGSDPHRVADLAIAYARGLEDGNVISVAKHFPGHGGAREDSHRALGIISSDEARIDSVDLYPFRAYSHALLSGVMVGHLASAALDTVRRPAIVSPVVMRDVLRGDLGFGGLVLTDALNMEGALGVEGWQAIAAGADMVIAPADTRREIAGALEALHDGRLTEEVVANRVRRILFYKYLTDAGRHEIYPATAAQTVNAGASRMHDTIISLLRHLH